jgi:hypothetical protein
MSTELRVLRLDLPGKWADGWLYKDHLILWSRTGDMFYLPLTDLVKLVRKLASPRLAVVADYLIFRSDWKVGEQFKRLLVIPGVEHDFLADFSADHPSVTIPLDDITPHVVPSDSIPGVSLDTAVYGNRVYVGSTAGLFETRFNPDFPRSRNPVVQQLDHRVSAVTAKYSAINCSTGEDGLWFSRVDFGDAEWWQRQRPPLRQVADVSYDNSFAFVNLLNYTDAAFPVFMRSDTIKERPHDNAEFKEWQVTGYQAPADIRGVMTSALLGPRRTSRSRESMSRAGSGPESAQVLGNSDQRLLVAWDNSLRVVDIFARLGREVEARSDTAFRSISQAGIEPSAILDTHPFSRGFLVELRDQVLLINTQGTYSIISEPIAKIRTFAHSRRHREVILLVRENGVSLLGVYLKREPEPEPEF